MKCALITGASGLVGKVVTETLSRSGWKVAPLHRVLTGEPSANSWDISAGHIQTDKEKQFDVVIHLAGESIAEGRWTQAKKQRIRNSRIEGTRLLCEHLASLPHKPAVLLSASASGFYGDRGDETLTESSEPGSGFLAETCGEWERATEAAEAAGIRVIHMRFSMVLSPNGGALAKVLPLFRMGLGGRLGSGHQHWSWIELNDLVRGIEFCIGTETISGPVNFTSPAPVTNREFTCALANAIRRPAILPAPAFGLRIALGEMADGLLLASARMVPSRLLESGFEFQSPTLDKAFASLSN